MQPHWQRELLLSCSQQECGARVDRNLDISTEKALHRGHHTQGDRRELEEYLPGFQSWQVNQKRFEHSEGQVKHIYGWDAIQGPVGGLWV